MPRLKTRLISFGHLRPAPVVEVVVLWESRLVGRLEEDLVQGIVVARVLHAHQSPGPMHPVLNPYTQTHVKTG